MNKLQAIQKGSQIIDEIFWELLKILKTRSNLTELSLARQIAKLAKLKGAEGLAFKPIVAFGSSAAEMHHWASKRKIGKNNFLLLDYGVKVSGYCSDFTRTLFLGKPTKFQEKIYNIVLQAQTAALKKVKPGAITRVVDKAARQTISKAGYGKYFIHSTGHGLGLKIHEWPNLSPKTADKLLKNYVVTVEPGIYLPKKFGIRIEDMVLVSNKPKIFSSVPKDFKSMVV